jgi:AcrR family transcriptional regulator
MPTSTAKRTVPAAARTSRRGRDRRLEIIKAARDVFLERGFLGASTDEILTRSGGSKETLYAHFGSKLGLFREVITAELQLIFATVTSKAGETPIDGLRLAGRAFVRQAMQPEKIRLMRILIAEGVRIPELTEQLHDTAYVQIKQLFIERIERVQAAGEFTGDSAATLAEVFLDLLQGETVFRTLLEPQFRMSARELDAHSDRSLERLARLARQPS